MSRNLRGGQLLFGQLGLDLHSVAVGFFFQNLRDPPFKLIDQFLIGGAQINGEPRVGRLGIHNLRAAEHSDVQIDLGILWQLELADSGDSPCQRYRSRIRRRLRSSVAARPDEMMLVPVYSDAAVCQSLITAVESDVLADSIAVLRDKRLHASKRSLLFDGEQEDQI